MVQVILAVIPLVWFSLSAPLRRSPALRLAGGVVAVAAAAAVFAPWPPPPGPWVAFLDVGQADSAVFRLSDGTVWVVDVGDDRGPGDAAANVVIPFLRHARVRRVEGVILSHRHRDHVGALDAFLSRVPANGVYDAAYGDGATARDVDRVLARHGVPLITTYAGDTLRARQDLSLVAWYPPPPSPGARPPSNLNDVSLVVALRDRGLSVLFAGDLEAAGERRFLARMAPEPMLVLKAGHHGSRTSTTEPWLQALSPAWAIISCGADNRFGHPGAETLDRLRAGGVRTLRTDQVGAVRIRPGDPGRVEIAEGVGPFRVAAPRRDRLCPLPGP